MAPPNPQLNKKPFDEWTTREKLALASYMQNTHDQNWISVRGPMRPFCQPNRPDDWLSKKYCALQYQALLNSVNQLDSTKMSNKRGQNTPDDLIVAKLRKERLVELEELIKEEIQNLSLLSKYDSLLSGEFQNIDDKTLDEIGKYLESLDLKDEEEAEKEKKMLEEREIKVREFQMQGKPHRPVAKAVKTASKATKVGAATQPVTTSAGGGNTVAFKGTEVSSFKTSKNGSISDKDNFVNSLAAKLPSSGGHLQQQTRKPTESDGSDDISSVAPSMVSLEVTPVISPAVTPTFSPVQSPKETLTENSLRESLLSTKTLFDDIDENNSKATTGFLTSKENLSSPSFVVAKQISKLSESTKFKVAGTTKDEVTNEDSSSQVQLRRGRRRRGTPVVPAIAMSTRSTRSNSQSTVKATVEQQTRDDASTSVSPSREVKRYATIEKDGEVTSKSKSEWRNEAFEMICKMEKHQSAASLLGPLSKAKFGVCCNMDLATIKKRIEGDIIQSWPEFRRDLLLAFNNRFIANYEWTDIEREAALKLQEAFLHMLSEFPSEESIDQQQQQQQSKNRKKKKKKSRSHQSVTSEYATRKRSQRRNKKK